MAKPTELSEVKKQMEACAVSGVLATTYHRITAGDLVGARGVLVIVLDAEGYVSHENSETLDGWSCMNMATVTLSALCKDYQSVMEE